KYHEGTHLLKQVLHSYNQLKKRIRDWELDYMLKSNRSGQVSFLQSWDTNQTVAKESLMFTISSEDNPYFVAKLTTPKINAGKIKMGQRVHLRLNDYPEYEFGVLIGHVTNITTVSNSDGTYNVDVKIPKDLKTTFGTHIDFKQDMQGTADIITEDLRLLERLFYQFRELYSR
ncbi:MAG: HlyD family secretion protein, partial [Gelidibacter sp.]|nr:HlyD family secretion protein [Gelidibacter sp.]